MEIIQDIYKIYKSYVNFPLPDIFWEIKNHQIYIRENGWFLSLAKIYLKYFFILDISKKMACRAKLTYNLELL